MMGKPRVRQLVGAVFLAQFVIVCAVNLASGTPARIWWISHVALVIAGAGLIIGRTLPVAAALVLVLFLHAVWLLDCGTWLVTGIFPLKVTAHLADAGAWRWIATLHHFYFAPLLLVLLWRRTGGVLAALPVAAAVYAGLTILARVLLPAQENINYAFTTPGFDHPIVRWGNGLPAAEYLLVLNLIVSGVIFFPTAALLDRWLRIAGPDAKEPGYGRLGSSGAGARARSRCSAAGSEP